jgi:glycosyltransferase involved in cell wall biosynthesis
VPSDFVKQTLVAEGVDESKIRIIPFGTDLTLFHPPEKRGGKTVVFLFVGGLTARKGLPVLLEAWRKLALPDAELWLAGSGSLPMSESASLPPTVKMLGPQGRQEVASLMRQADVFVFPSFFEGLAQVQIEAQATGLPLIATHEAGAADLIQEGTTGFLIRAGDMEALAVRIQRLAQDASLRQQMQQSALVARDRLSWRIYGTRWSTLLKEI